MDFRRSGVSETRVNGNRYYNRDVRAQLRSGDVLLFKGDIAFSRLIEAVEGGTYSHSAFVLRWNARAMVVQAEFPRLEAVPTSIAIEKYSGRVDWYRLRPEVYANLDVARLTHEATRLLGRSFAVLDLLRVGLYNMLEKPIPKQKNPEDAFFCSEYVAHCFRKAGFPLVPEKNALAVTPDDLSRSGYLENMGPIHWDPDHREDALDRGFTDEEVHVSPGSPSSLDAGASTA